MINPGCVLARLTRRRSSVFYLGRGWDCDNRCRSSETNNNYKTALSVPCEFWTKTYLGTKYLVDKSNHQNLKCTNSYTPHDYGVLIPPYHSRRDYSDSSSYVQMSRGTAIWKRQLMSAHVCDESKCTGLGRGVRCQYANAPSTMKHCRGFSCVFS